MAYVGIQDVEGIQEIEHCNSNCDSPRKHRIWLHCVTVVNSPCGDNSITVHSFVKDHHVQLSFPDITLQLETNSRNILAAIDLHKLPRFTQHFPIYTEYNGQMLSGLIRIRPKDSNGHHIEFVYDALNRVSTPIQGSIIKIYGSSISWICK